MRTQSSDARRRASHLLSRAGFGPMPQDVERVLTIGIDSYVDEQLHPETIDDSEIDRWDSAFATRSAAPAKLRADYPAPSRGIVNQLAAYKIMRAIHSKRQLSEMMSDFWSNHFNIDWSKNEAQFLLPDFDKQVIRPLSLGKFSELLPAVARHPAMLVYLDNALSAAPNVNENYGRELLELHTMGVDGGYTQRDVEEVARCFSGWTIDKESLTFHFDPSMHDTGTKTVLGETIAPAGYEEGEKVIRILSEHPATARFIAGKLVRRFVADEARPALVDRIAALFRSTGGDIRAMVRALLTSEEFFASENYRAKVKSPFEFVVSAVRAMGADVRIPSMVIEVVRLQKTAIRVAFGRGMAAGSPIPFDVRDAVRHMDLIIPDIQAYAHMSAQLEQMGQFLFQIESPAGLPEDSRRWLHLQALVDRMRLASTLAQGTFPGVVVQGGPWPSLWREIVDQLTGITPQAPATKEATPGDPAELALALASAEFQLK